MKFKFYQPQFLLVIVFAIAFFGCNSNLFNDCSQGKGPSKTFFVTTQNFNQLKLLIPAKVILKQDSSYKIPQLRIFSQSNVFERIAINQLGNEELSIDFKECVTQYQPIEIEIFFSELSGISVEGPTDVVTQSMVFVDTFNLSLNSTALLDLSLRGNLLNVTANGAGNITLNGATDIFKVTQNSIGQIAAFNLETDSCNFEINNAGGVEVTSRAIKAANNGAGLVYFKGKPRLFVTDSSKVIDANL